MRPVDMQILFREAVLDLAYAPTRENVRRYLAASRLLAVGAGVRNAGHSDGPGLPSSDAAPTNAAIRARRQ